MRKKKLIKIVSLIITISLLLSSGVLAKNDKNRGNSSKDNKVHWNNSNHKNSKVFDDVDEKHWADKDIKRMSSKRYILGDGKGKFLPNKPAKNIEVIVMTLRIMGVEDELQELEEIPDFIEGLNIPEWSVPYVAYANEMGIITKDELKDFNANAAAKRYMVAKYIIRALGLDEKAFDSNDEYIDFDDASFIPEGNRGYVYLIDKLGLMSGYKKKFNPNSNLTRAEMAVLFSRLDNKIDSDEEEVEMGEFVQVADDIITIRDDYGYERYLLGDDVIIYNIEGKEIKLSELESGDKLQLEFFDHKVVFIEIFEEKVEKILETFQGEVSKVVDDKKDTSISIMVDDKEMTFEIDKDTRIKKDSDKKSLKLKDIHKGDVVKLTKITEDDDSYVTEIILVEPETKTDIYEGVITALTKKGHKEQFTIRKDNNIEKTFPIDKETMIKKEGEDKKLKSKDLKIGGVVQVVQITKGNSVYVEEIEIQKQSDEPIVKVYEGEVISLAETVNEKLITVDVDNTHMTFTIDKNTLIREDDETEDIDDIEIDDEVRITEIITDKQVKVVIVDILD
ncbi:hypothetical protein SH1V18_36950 [Vallitalea longa]|uniref:SLH domain-containing protein n=1 Tax=Vallitalea longa TaxID=2936439 RepID=A0A9W6DG38_9FIRM|nr:S-layer homology domain-containing protein [Vallitalea longa]GKX31215.1 hypothetical protein SH1V18_36950 [Vallitalea longa]